MRYLLLNGHGINIWVDSAKLHITDGRWNIEEEPEHYVFYPKTSKIDEIILYGHTGNISLESIRWLVKHNIGLTVLNWNGKLLTSIQSPGSIQIKNKFQQYKAYSDEKKRISIAKKFVEAKIYRSEEVLKWLNEKYSNINTDISNQKKLFNKAKTILDINMSEGRIARHYWAQIKKIIPNKYEFENRNNQTRPAGAIDPINALLNYGYALLESQCIKAIYSTGLDPYVGFLHENYLGKTPLVYDLQEPFRFLVDLAVISALENNIFEKKDFIRTENYNIRLMPSGAKKLTKEIAIQFSRKTNYKGDKCAWHYLILLKAIELAQYLNKMNKKLSFSVPVNLNRNDSSDLREIILNMGYKEGNLLGIPKGALHYMKQNAKSNKPFKIYETTKEKIVNYIK